MLLEQTLNNNTCYGVTMGGGDHPRIIEAKTHQQIAKYREWAQTIQEANAQTYQEQEALRRGIQRYVPERVGWEAEKYTQEINLEHIAKQVEHRLKNFVEQHGELVGLAPIDNPLGAEGDLYLPPPYVALTADGDTINVHTGDKKRLPRDIKLDDRDPQTPIYVGAAAHNNQTYFALTTGVIKYPEEEMSEPLRNCVLARRGYFREYKPIEAITADENGIILKVEGRAQYLFHKAVPEKEPSYHLSIDLADGVRIDVEPSGTAQPHLSQKDDAYCLIEQ